MKTSGKVREHYGSDGIADRLLQALAATGASTENLTPLDLAPLDQFHSRGLEATKELAALLAPTADEHVLDIGCGIGGPARYIAYAHGCRVTGIDLTPEFIAAAEQLNSVTKLSERVGVQCGSATDLPFAEATFDAAYSQNVVMNIEDKAAFYREAWRVLRPGGRLALSNLALGPAGPPLYPVPWAERAETSFLTTPAESRALIEATGFEIASFAETTETMLVFYVAQRERIQREGPPALGVHLLMGDRIKGMQRNVAQSMEEGRIVPVEILCRKP
jgi:SAM-dependent methyltransferase